MKTKNDLARIARFKRVRAAKACLELMQIYRLYSNVAFFAGLFGMCWGFYQGGFVLFAESMVAVVCAFSSGMNYRRYQKREHLLSLIEKDFQFDKPVYTQVIGVESGR